MRVTIDVTRAAHLASHPPKARFDGGIAQSPAPLLSSRTGNGSHPHIEETKLSPGAELVQKGHEKSHAVKPE
jgi:hypothetical protein